LTPKPRRPRHTRIAGLAAALIAMAVSAIAAPGSPAGTGGLATEQELWLVVEVNHTGSGEPFLLLRLPDGRLLARAQDLAAWRLELPASAAVASGGERFYALDDLPGLSYAVDDARQVLIIEAAPGLFPPTHLNGRAEQFARPAASPPGVFLNYDVSTQISGGHKQSGALLEVGAFNRAGAGIGDFLVRDHGVGERFVRLETRWTQDHLDALASLRIGDGITGAGSWSRSVRFGGVQWATDFATQPDFVPFPLPQFSGQAALPSTVDLVVDHIERLSRDVPPGPFDIVNLPVVTGSGEARVVVRDLLGREQTVALAYYVSPALLKAGLDEYSYEAGFVRNRFGIASNDYGRFVAAGTSRHGFSDAFTGEVHAEIQRSQQTAGVGGTLLVDTFGTFNAALAASHAPEGGGGLVEAGFQRQAPVLSFGGSVQLASRHFSELGMADGAPAPRAIGRAYAALGLRGHGTVGLSYSAQLYRDRDPVRILDASYSVSLGHFGLLAFSAARMSAAGHASMTYGLTFTRPLSEDTSASAGLFGDGGATHAQLDLQRNVPVGDGYGYRVRLDAGDSARGDATLVLQNGVGTYTLEAERAPSVASFRAGAAGSIVRFGGDWFFSRRIDQSFGVIEVPGFAGVRIYADNQPVATTNANGNAFVPRLRPYQNNPIRIEQADLPLDAEIDATELAAVPAFGSGTIVTFPVRRSLGGIVRIVLAHDVPVPAGAQVNIEGRAESFAVGLDGEAYLTGLAASNRVHISWRDQACDLLVLYAPSTEPVAQLGTYMCEGARP
jgi:outer membrane usher protein